MYPHAMANALPAVSSDHSPILLEPIPGTRSGVQFKYEVFWNEHTECKNVVSKGWHEPQIQNDQWKNTLQRMKTCKRSLSNWHKATFKAADKEITSLKQQLNDIQCSNDGHERWAEVADLKKQISELWKQEEAYWGQRSRLKWAKMGDKNTKFFHNTTLQRRDKNRMQRMKDDSGQ